MSMSEHLRKSDQVLSSGIILVSGRVAFYVQESSWNDMSFWDHILYLPMTATSQAGVKVGKKYWLNEVLESGEAVLYCLGSQ